MDTINLFDIKGKVALITGSTQGLGLSFARGLAAAGSKVILNGRNKNKLKSTVVDFKNLGYDAFGYSFDVCNENELKKAVEKIKTEVGQIDILVNNAGVQVRGPLENFELDSWKKIIDVNLTGAFLVSKTIVKDMILRRSGKIINICSVQSSLARQDITPYTASKGGIKNLTKGMATEWAKYNIQVNGIAPGYFKTELTEALLQNSQFDAWLRDRTPAGRWGEPEELVGALIFLSSDASTFVNGHILYVDGGITVSV